MIYSKGKKKSGGRKPGSVNKTTRAVKEALELAFEGTGGQDQFNAWARANRTEFYKLWGKMLPQDLNVKAELTLEQLVLASRDSDAQAEAEA